MMKVENWCGYDIRFIEQDGEWWAILKDICDALQLKTKYVSQRLDPDMMIRVKVDGIEVVSNDVNSCNHSSNGVRCDMPSNHINSRGAKSFWMIAVNELGIYEALFSSRRLEARKFRRWTSTVMKKLRQKVGLEGYEVMKMLDKDTQDSIDNILDTLFYDEETGKVMQSVTVQGGDVDQVPFLD